ncbi:hypothetical protein E9124_24270, partial [Salmonella enterica subsp. enterica serovar Goldcoast]
VPAYGPQNDVTLKMPAFEWVHVQLHQQKGMISLSPPTICNSANSRTPAPSGQKDDGSRDTQRGRGVRPGKKMDCACALVAWERR